MHWYPASMRDGDTHLGLSDDGRTVRTPCGRIFRPVTRLPGEPPDPLQTCPACLNANREEPDERAGRRPPRR